jgi:ribosomal protein RSM22 (predicted rRNA methylase)
MSQLPPALRAALAALSEGRGRAELARRSQAISEGYRARRGSEGALRTADDALAYALARMPATFAAVEAALTRLLDSAPDLAPKTLLDVGCGPGTAAFAAAQAFPSLSDLTLLDRNGPLLALARTLAVDTLPKHLASFHDRELTAATALPSADLVTASYVLAEMQEAARAGLVIRLWRSAGMALVLVEPGTPDGFARLQAARTALIAAGAHVAAPCTHGAACPMAGEDWCRFFARVQRTRDHKLLKHGDRPYEDEPYAYLAVTREPAVAKPSHRIIARPVETKGSILLDLCGPQGRSPFNAAARDRENFKRFSRLRWGDAATIQSLNLQGPMGPTEGIPAERTGTEASSS